MVQWTPTTKFFKWAGLDVKAANELVANNPKKMINLQLDFLIFDLKLENGNWGDYSKKLSMQHYEYMSASDFIKSELPAGILAKYFETLYERSGDIIDGYAHRKRVEYAEYWQTFFNNMGIK